MDEWMKPAEVSELTRGALTQGGLAQLRYTGQGPRFYKPTARTVLYKRSEVLAWLEESARTSTAQVSA